ncbi:related to phosphatidylserine decarboxylase proenzyme 2 precursor [Ramularia collo-cygni]|uniref:phosphatidylserine decarboxylase n=1 Tax=Ramularia collo-cygni TaxID=112498 RepID=A0A2D3URT6_9PEZI|nr:related to phosphatidylserine decarboxylase proenzyme 2 precursor [Ramularia collo-cygni]CZT18811.1 related to phosphatidylserine decarboxylase proenzyme 2 precursor [Ramularia collo-cygni]
MASPPSTPPIASSTTGSKNKPSLSQEHLTATETALDTLTTSVTSNHSTDPKEQLHAPANKDTSHAWLRSLFPYNSLQEFETAWHLGNYVLHRKSGEKEFEEMSIYVRLGMHLLYYGTEQEKALHWKRTQAMLKEQSVKMGKMYDEPESKEHIEPFIESFGLQDSLSDLKEPDPTKYPTFNAFFAREIKPSARPITSPAIPHVVSSPADCRLTVFPTITLATKFWIKGFGFSLPSLLKSPSLAQEFSAGSINIARLAPQDYHRWHSPIDGIVESITEIDGTYYTVNPQAVCEEGTLDVFCENRRSVMVLKRKGSGRRVAIVAVGAMLVGSVRYVYGVNVVGKEVRRGECLGWFQYGGSTVIVLYPEGEVVLDDDLVKNSTEKVCETLVRVGERVGEGPLK